MYYIYYCPEPETKPGWHTVNREYFDVKIFSDTMACVKIKRTKYMRDIINDNVVQDHLSENYLSMIQMSRQLYTEVPASKNQWSSTFTAP